MVSLIFILSKIWSAPVEIRECADNDGANIELLLITFFFTYMRPLVEAGRLYRAVTPLYILKKKGSSPIYCYTDEEYAAHRNQGYEVTRLKGLGECNSDVLHEICFAKENYKRITVKDAAATSKLLDTLMGKNVAPRRQFLYDNASRIGFDFN